MCGCKDKYTKKHIKLEKKESLYLILFTEFTKKLSVFILEIILEIIVKKLFLRNVLHCVPNWVLIRLRKPFVLNFSGLQLNKLVIAVLWFDQLSTLNEPRATSLNQVSTSLPPILMGVNSLHLCENWSLSIHSLF